MINGVRKLFAAKQRPKTIRDLTPVFQDMDGQWYYGFPPTFGAFPLDRHAKRADTIQWMSAGLTNKELESLIDIAINEMENLAAGKKGSLVKVGAVLYEIKKRSTLALHHELVYQFIAVHYVRADENIYEVVDSVADEKIEAFKKMVAGGRLLDFFHLPELTNICSTIGLSSEEFLDLWSESVAEMKVLNQKILYLKSRQKTSEDVKT